MTCQDCELLLAEESSTPEVEAHLATCADCGVFKEDLRANAATLSAMRFDPIANRPLTEPRPSGSVLRLRPLAMWTLAAAAAIVLTVGLQKTHQPPAPQTVTKAPEPVATPIEVASVIPPPKPRRAVARRPRMREAQETMLVKMMTPDPDVVIYWLVEPQPGQ
jgi:hypothetical protein